MPQNQPDEWPRMARLVREFGPAKRYLREAASLFSGRPRGASRGFQEMGWRVNAGFRRSAWPRNYVAKRDNSNCRERHSRPILRSERM